MKIFAIDDEKASLYFLTKAIKEACPNDEIKQFEDYKTFLEEFKKDLPEIVFLDVQMPEMDGITLAKKIIEIKKEINIIFVTAWSEYAFDAFKLNATNYIVKPASKEKILSSIEHLRFDLEKEKDLVIKTFGNFDVFYKGESVRFRSNKSKEILAYLIDREGAMVTKKELGAVIYEDDYSRNVQSYLSRNIRYLNEDLVNSGINNFLIIDEGYGYRVDLSLATCDLIDYLQGKNTTSFTGEYMEQYSFAETRKYNLQYKK